MSRVESFEHLGAPRIGLPDGAGEAPMRELCPDVSDMCQQVLGIHRLLRPQRHDSRRATASCSSCAPPGSRAATTSGGGTTSSGKEAGLTAEEIARVTAGPHAPGWDDFERALLAAADELHASRFISDSTWNVLAEGYTDDELRQVVMVVGNYTQLAMFQNALGAQLPAGSPRLPADGGR